MSHRFFSEALLLLYEHACALSNLSYFPNLVLTLMSVHMREREHMHAHTQVVEIPKKVDGLYLTTSASLLSVAMA